MALLSTWYRISEYSNTSTCILPLSKSAISASLVSTVLLLLVRAGTGVWIHGCSHSCWPLSLLIRPNPHYYLQTVISPWQRCCRCSNKPALRGLWSIMDYSLMAHVLSAQPHQLLLLRIALARIPLQVHYDICASLSSVTACTPIDGVGSWVLFPL